MLYYSNEHNLYFNLEPDNDYIESPRENGYDSTFITFERDYNSPDEHEFEDFKAVLSHLGTKHTGHMYNDLESLQETSLKNGYVALPVWKYEHGGVVYRASEHYPFAESYRNNRETGYEGGFDGGLCGIIFEKRNRRDVEQVKNELKAQVDEYSQYANGDIYRVEAYDKEGFIVESVGGFYADYGDETLVAEFASDYMGLEIHKNDLETIGFEYDYMPVEIDPDLVDDEFEFEDVEYRSLSIVERIAAHQEGSQYQIDGKDEISEFQEYGDER